MEIAKKLSACYTGAVHDVMRAEGFRDFVLPPDIRPVVHGRGMAGPVYTIEGQVVPGVDAHETLLAWTGFLSRAPSGHVVICKSNDDQVAHMGELSAETLALRGVAGYITDGGCRDVEAIEAISLPVYARYYTPRDVVGYWTPASMGSPIRIGSVDVRTGDYVLADKDGVVVIPADAVERIVQATETIMLTENKVRKAIQQGEDPQQAYRTYGKF